MGTIAQKLEYLNDTRLLLKDNINKINNVLTDNSTFRSYPQELFNGYLDVLNNGTDTLWNNLEKVSQTGTEAVLENVETAPMKMVLNGNTSQDGTPTPDTPVEVKVVTGENVVSVSRKNLLGLTNGTYSHNGITAVVSDGTITITGTATANSFVNIPLLKNIVLSDEQVTITTNNATTISDSATEFRVYESGNNYMPVDFTSINSKRTYTKTGTFVSAYVRTTSGVSYGSGIVIKPQLELGSTATPYVPYSKTDYPINLASKNLFSTENLVNATITDTGEYLTGDNRCTGDYVFLDKSQENLALSFNLNILFMGIAFYDENKQYLSRATINNTNLLTAPIPTNAEYCRPFFQFTTSPAAKIDAKIVQQLGTQLEYGTERTNYVSYFTPIELCKINTYKDYFHKDSGKWYVHKEIEKVVLDGSEQMNFQGSASTPTERTIYRWYLPTYAQTDNYLSNKFIKGSSTSNRIVIVSGNDRPYISIDNLLAEINVEDDNNTKLAKFKTWLSNNNVILYYILATPTETEITNTTLIEQLEAIYKAKSVKDKTYITQTNDDLPFILDVEAIKEYEVN